MVGVVLANGLSYGDFLKMTMVEVESFIKGCTAHRELRLNDNLYVAHTQSILISQAVWGSKEFPKSPPKVDLTSKKEPKSKEDYLQALVAFKKAVHNEFSLIKV